MINIANLKRNVLALFLLICSTGLAKTQFAVVILTYNNQDYCEANLQSALDQNYDKFRIIIIDDASTDQTSVQIKKLIQNHPRKNRVTYKKNKKRQGAMANHITAVNMCHDAEIVVHLDGDDMFAHTGVLKRLAEEYKDPNCWMTYGSYQNLSDGGRGHGDRLPQSVIKHNTVRRYGWVTSHVRSFYAKLFKKIEVDDFKYNNEFVAVACDVAFMLPMLEMAGNHSRYIHDILYRYNDLTPQNDHKLYRDHVLKTARFIRNKPRYKPLANLW